MPSGYASGVTSPQQSASTVHRISVVTPVYQGELTLPSLAEEIEALTRVQTSPDGHQWVVMEWLLVHDNGPDDSATVIRHLARTKPFVRPVWLSRNFGQHAATLAGMASSSGQWIATLDEDGQHDPVALGAFLDAGLRDRAQVVYAAPTNPAPHGLVRNALSTSAKAVASWLVGTPMHHFHSFRLLLGETGRSVAAYVGSGVYLDVALTWVVGTVTQVPVELRRGSDRPSGYSLRRLSSHFWRLVLSSGTRGLRLVSALGGLLGLAGLVFAAYVVASSLMDANLPEGWATTVVVVLLASGAVLFSLGVIAEYVGVAVNMAMGRPPYLVVGDPADGPLGPPPAPRPPT